MQNVLSALQSCSDQGRKAIVHCWGGIVRTGLTMAAWLVHSGQAEDGETALRILAEKWKTVHKRYRSPTTPETRAQFEFIISRYPRRV